jgi:hypothetical protein
VRLAKTIVRPFKEEFGAIIARIKRHTKLVDSTARVIEMSRASVFRKGKVTIAVYMPVSSYQLRNE